MSNLKEPFLHTFFFSMNKSELTAKTIENQLCTIVGRAVIDEPNEDLTLLRQEQFEIFSDQILALHKQQNTCLVDLRKLLQDFHALDSHYEEDICCLPPIVEKAFQRDTLQAAQWLQLMADLGDGDIVFKDDIEVYFDVALENFETHRSMQRVYTDHEKENVKLWFTVLMGCDKARLAWSKVKEIVDDFSSNSHVAAQRECEVNIIRALENPKIVQEICALETQIQTSLKRMRKLDATKKVCEKEIDDARRKKQRLQETLNQDN